MTQVAAALAARPDVAVHPPAPGAPGVHHLAFTDSLYAGGIAAAVSAHLALAAALRGPAVVTLHDVPHPGGGARDRRRADGYRSVAARADGVVVCSDEEADRVRVLTGRLPAVIPLPIARRPVPPLTAPLPPWSAVAVLGWIFPGKGHDVAVDVAASAGLAGVVAVGAPAPGHDGLVADLRRRAAAAGVRWHVTGHLDDGQLLAAAAAVDVPVAAYAGTSASASLRSWVAAGRRPLASATPDARRLFGATDERLHRPGDRIALTAQAVRAAGDPTWTRGGHAVAAPDVAAAHLAVYRAVAAVRA